MTTQTVNISFEKDLLKKLDQTAGEEFRSRSELIREAARRYIDSKKRWKEIFAFGKKQAKALKLEEEDIPQAIATFRKNKPSR